MKLSVLTAHTVIFLLTFGSYSGQELPADSLMEMKDDSAKVEILYRNAQATAKENHLEKVLAYHSAIESAKKCNYRQGVIKSYNGLLFYLYDAHMYILASEQAKDFLHYCEKRKLNNELVQLYSILGNAYGQQGNYFESLKYLHLKDEHNLKNEDFKSYASTLYQIGMQHAQHGHPDSALMNTLWSAEIFKRNNMSAEMAQSLLGTARIYSEMKNFSAANEKANEAYAIYQANSNRSGIMHACEILGQLAHMAGKTDTAFIYYEHALRLADSVQSLSCKKECYKHLSELYGAVGKYKESYDMQLLYKKTRDVIESDAQLAKLTESKIRYELSSLVHKKNTKPEAIYEGRQKKLILFLLAVIALLTYLLVKEKLKKQEPGQDRFTH